MSETVSAKARRKMTNHPSYSSMIKGAISNLKERSGSSKVAILKYMLLNYNLGQNIILVNAHLRLALKRGVAKGELKQVKGTGVSGSFRLSEKSVATKKIAKKPIATNTSEKKTTKSTTRSKTESNSVNLKTTDKGKAGKKSPIKIKTPKARKSSAKIKAKKL